MSNGASAKTGPAEEAIPLKEFLESSPPGHQRRVSRVTEDTPEETYVATPSLQLFCDSDSCGGIRFFDAVSKPIFVTTDEEWLQRFLTYYCRHCCSTRRIFAILIRRLTLTEGEAVKLGEWPTFGPHIPTKMFSLLGEDQDLFHKGRRAESQGMGIGAFAYYRRVVENQKNRLIAEIIKVSQKLGAGPEVIANLETARHETQFHKAVGIIKEGIPDALRIAGQNPLALLHSALSDGLHEQSDEECLTRATVIRTVMADLSERIVEAVKDQKELNDAVSKLLQIQTASRSKLSAIVGGPKKTEPTAPSSSAAGQSQAQRL